MLGKVVSDDMKGDSGLLERGCYLHLIYIDYKSLFTARKLARTKAAKRHE